MRKMNKKATRIGRFSRGFTLLEIMLVMSIIVIFSSIIYATFYIVNTSYARVAVLNDAKDFAAMNMQAIEANLVNANFVLLSDSPSLSQATTDHLLVVDATGLKLNNASGSHVVLPYSKYKVSKGNVNIDKWTLSTTYTKSGTSILITISVMDNAKPAAPAFYTLTKTIFLPNITVANITGNASGTCIYYKNFSPP